MNNLEKRIDAIEKRNTKVENDKMWEMSNFRKISVAVTTYFNNLYGYVYFRA